ncbi:nucleoside-triphosphatase [Streptomyces sp. NPDC052396]|uniref:nucleoside-triphosphatase n=1 Tax=Streptomyces sp. NPDC052396 TaxID=3365689 RepID=UPI0037D22D6C
MPTRILLEGRPGVGKTTVVRRLAALLHTRKAVGFTTQEIRQGGTRTGFALEPLAGGLRAVLADVDFPGPPRVGRYGIDLGVMERLALPPLRSAATQPVPGELVLIDELGRMELACTAFQDTVRCLFTSEIDIVATVHAKSAPFTDALKQRAGIELIQVTQANRDTLPEALAARLESP